MRNLLKRQIAVIALLLAAITSSSAQNAMFRNGYATHSMNRNSLSNANRQNRNMMRPDPQPIGGVSPDQPLLGTERVYMPDGHIIEYRHVYHGPVVFDSVPYERMLQAHFIPFAGLRVSDVIAGERLRESPLKTGVNAGFRVDWYKNEEKSVYIATGLNYALTKLEYNYVDWSDINTITVETLIHNLFVPIYVGPQFHFKNNASFGFGFGGQFGVIAYAEARENDDVYNPYSTLFDGNLGAELWYAHKNLFVNFQYSWGFQELEYGAKNNWINYVSPNRQTFALNIGYRIFQK